MQAPLLVGHQNRWRALARAFANGRAPQTLLVSGPPQVGKSTFVTLYSQLLLCPNLETDNEGLPMPCRTCRVCHQIEIETFPDFRIFRPIISASEPTTAPEELDSSNFNVGKAREASDEALRKPIAGSRKVIVLAQFDRANDEAENALLKTLEEPPPSTHLILTSDNARNLKATILSRCWHLQLAPASDAEIAAWLETQFPESIPRDVSEALRTAAGRPGTAWRELKRLSESDDPNAASRFSVALRMVQKLDSHSPVGALGLSEEALRVSKVWWEEDTGDAGDPKKLGAKAGRAAAVRLLDELSRAGRTHWVRSDNGQIEPHNATRLDLIRQTRQHILRNANLNLALDVLFGRLISLRQGATGDTGQTRVRR